MLAVVLPTWPLVLRPRRAGEHDRADDGAVCAIRVNESRSRPTGASWRPAMALLDSRFLTLAIPFALGLTAQVGFLTHQVAFLSPLMGTVAAGWAVSLTTSAAIVGRIATGAFVDQVDRRAAACANFLVQVVALGILVGARSAPMLYLGCALFGLGVGNMISLPGLIVQQEFREQDFARVVSLVVAVNQFTFAFGPALLGALRQAGGSYTTPLAVCLAMQALAAIIVMAPRLAGFARDREPFASVATASEVVPFFGISSKSLARDIGGHRRGRSRAQADAGAAQGALSRRAAGRRDHAEGRGRARRGRDLLRADGARPGRCRPASRDRRQRPARLLGRHAARGAGRLRRRDAERGRDRAGDSCARGTVRAEGDLDFRGTLGVAKDAPVGFKAIRLRFDLDSDASEEQLATLMKLTERYCVVYQTLRQPPAIEVGCEAKP